ncbi:uncharacterized protein LOC115952172 [Quercus lobata]|uniref:uncharacterized protein LOC115952172 n=1 Tax=Quercus lobata TaxID=97700 RepID=UPI001247EBA9|nr:uncharacterized protein LOC115952172 [Quercus lobata]
MCCFKLPKGLVRDLESMISKFWWGYSGEHRKTHWVKWERLCEAKEVGGLGFREIEKFNDALLARQVWRMINNTDSLCHRVFKARFFPDCSILDAKESSSGSYAWKSIIGEAVRIKEDRWLPGHVNGSVISPLPSMAPDVKVSSLIDPARVAWRTEVVQQLFLPHEADMILGIPLSSRRPDDRIIGAHTPSGMFTSCSAYKLLVSCDISTSVGGSNPNRRNAVHFGRPPLPVDSICSKAGNYLQEFLQAQLEEPIPIRLPPSQQWRPPDHHCLKINFDAAVFRRSSKASIGVVIRNNAGEVEGALSSSIPMAHSVADLEALACLKAVQFALELGITRAVFEGDSAVIINALLHSVGAFATFGNILDDIRMLSTVFQFVEFIFVNRGCNSVADALAKKAKLIIRAQVWLHDVPADIAPLVSLEVH